MCLGCECLTTYIVATVETKPVLLTIRLTADDKASLSELAAAEDRSEAAIIRLAIREYAERHPVPQRKKRSA